MNIYKKYITKKFRKIPTVGISIIVLGILITTGGVVKFVQAQIDPESGKNNISELLIDKSTKERANIKGQEIAKVDFRGEYINQKYGVKIDIQSIKAFDGGIEVFARAWKGEKQLGFGKDGSVEIERFLIYNPPILIDDSNGTVVREWTDSITGELKQRKLTENPVEAVRQSLSHTIKLIGKEDTNIVKGKIGNTTSTFRPDAGTGNTTVDGMARYQKGAGSGDTWSNVAAGTGDSSNDTGGSIEMLRWVADTTASQWRVLQRGILTFDTSSIGSDTINSATLSIEGTAKADPLSDTPNLNIYSSGPASNNAVVAGDYDSLGSTEFSTSITFGSFSTSAFNDWALNASGIANIATTGISKFGVRNPSFDVADSAPTYNSGSDTNIFGLAADTTGTASDPKLVVEHTTPDITAPVISSLQSSNVTDTSAIITWTTDEPADSKVTHGTTTPVGNSNPILETSDSATTTSHSISLTGLEKNTTYYYVAVSSDDSGNIATSSESSFTTLQGPVLFAHKEQDQATSSQATLFVDNDLSIALIANTSYVITAAITASSTAIQPDINMSFNAPPEASMALTFGSFDGTNKVAGSGLFSNDDTEVNIDLPATGLVVIHINGVITTGATAGTVEFEWAQNTSHATEVKVFKGSYLRAEEI